MGASLCHFHEFRTQGRVIDVYCAAKVLKNPRRNFPPGIGSAIIVTNVKFIVVSPQIVGFCTHEKHDALLDEYCSDAILHFENY